MNQFEMFLQKYQSLLIFPSSSSIANAACGLRPASCPPLSHLSLPSTPRNPILLPLSSKPIRVLDSHSSISFPIAPPIPQISIRRRSPRKSDLSLPIRLRGRTSARRLYFPPICLPDLVYRLPLPPSWRPNARRSATWVVASFSRAPAAAARRLLCMTTTLAPRLVPAAKMLSWRGGSNPLGFSTWPRPWHRLTIACFQIS